jgi:hypothetical protein
MVLQGEKTSVKLSKLSNFKVMPNPFTNEIRLETSSKNYTIYLMDVMGKTVLRSDNLNNNQIIETSSLAKGTYFLKIVTENGIEVIKLLK